MRSAQITFAALVQDFFCHHLVNERGASHRTNENYRDAFELLFTFILKTTGARPTNLCVQDLDTDLITQFLDYLEHERGNSIRTRNARLATIHSFMRYASMRDPAPLAVAKQVLAIGTKRYDKPVLGYLSREQITAILAAPDQRTWGGHRDAVMFATLYNTGARVSEITGLTRSDVLLERESAVHLHGKGRKERAIPLWGNTANSLRTWLERIDTAPAAPVFPNRTGKSLTRSEVRQRLDRAVATAEIECPSLASHSISPHTLRHSTAMHLLQSGIDLSVIALWLGHESPATTHQYLEADLAMKEHALTQISDPSTTAPRYQPQDRILAFLQTL